MNYTVRFTSDIETTVAVTVAAHHVTQAVKQARIITNTNLSEIETIEVVSSTTGKTQKFSPWNINLHKNGKKN